MTSHIGARAWIVATFVAVAVLSGTATVAAVWLVAAAGVVVLPGGAAKFFGPQGREEDVTEVLVTAEQTGGSLGMFRQTIAPGKGPAVHVHHAEDEFFYIVSGEFKLKVGDRVVTAPAQSLMFVPRGTAHTFLNVGTQPGVLLVGVTPGGLEGMFSKRQGVDVETNRMLMKAHNTEIVGPPLQ